MTNTTGISHTVASQPSLKSTAVQPGRTEVSDFRSLLSTMLLSTMMDGEGNGSTSLLTVALSSLMEQMMALQVEEQAEEPVEEAFTESYEVQTGYEAGGGRMFVGDTHMQDSGTGSAVPSGWPVQGRLTQNYHASHNGLDIAIPVGTAIQSTMAGKVVYAGWNTQGYGNLVIVENGPYRTYYAHLSEVPVKVGDTVNSGSVIGLSGNTGNSTGPHLHYEVRLNHVAVNPSSYTSQMA